MPGAGWRVSVPSPNLCAWSGRVCVFAGDLQAGPAGKQGDLGSGLGYQVGRGSMLAPGEMCKCGVPARQMHECCLFAGSTKMHQPASRGPVGWVRGTRSGQGYRGDRGAVPVHEGSVAMCVLVNIESVVCVPAQVTSCLCQPKRRRKGRGCLCLCFMGVLHVGAVDSSASSLAVCVTGCVSVLCLRVCISGMRAQLRYTFHRQAEKW